VVPHDEQAAVAKVIEDTRHLVGFLREAFEVVVANLAVDLAARLIVDRQPFLWK
jgi:hypothetical protein